MARIGLIAFFAVLSFAVSFALKLNAGGESQVGAPAGEPAATAQVSATTVPVAPELQRGIPTAVAAMDGVPEAPDTTGLQQPLGIDELLDMVNADSADGFTPVDRRRFTAQLESDPALRQALLREALDD